jgi:DNA-binding transcriptional LysR family regulator
MDIDKARRRIRLRDLETLTAVVRSGGMRKAASELHVTQPAVSRVIADLEDTLGLPLLDRGRRGVEPTVYGSALVGRARVLVDELQGALRELAYLSDPTAGEVSLGCMETLHAGMVGATVADMLSDSPDMRFRLELGQSKELVDYFLSQRLVDFVVSRPYSMPLPPGIDGEPLFHDRLLLIAGASSPHLRRRRVALADLVDDHWILSSNELTGSLSPVVQAFMDAGLSMPRRVIVSGSLHMRYNLIDSGRFVTAVPSSLIPFLDRRHAFRILPIEMKPWPTPTMILTVRGRTMGPAAERFLDRLRVLAKPIAEGSAARGSLVRRQPPAAPTAPRKSRTAARRR